MDDLYIYEYLNHGNIIAMAKFRCGAPLAAVPWRGRVFYTEGISDEIPSAIALSRSTRGSATKGFDQRHATVDLDLGHCLCSALITGLHAYDIN